MMPVYTVHWPPHCHWEDETGLLFFCWQCRLLQVTSPSQVLPHHLCLALVGSRNQDRPCLSWVLLWAIGFASPNIYLMSYKHVLVPAIYLLTKATMLSRLLNAAAAIHVGMAIFLPLTFQKLNASFLGRYVWATSSRTVVYLHGSG